MTQPRCGRAGAAWLRGFTTAAGAVGGGILIFGANLDLAYMRQRKPERLRGHRTDLDKIVRCQLLTIGVAGVALAIAISTTDTAPLDHIGRLIKALIIGLAVAINVIYTSALVDWYWVLSKVSGVLGPGHCYRSQRRGRRDKLGSPAVCGLANATHTPYLLQPTQVFA